MQKVYEFLNKYAKLLCEQDDTPCEGSQLFIETDDGIFSTKPGADLNNLRPEDIQKEYMEKLPLSDSEIKAMVHYQSPYCSQCLRQVRPLKPALDDMAQIIGAFAPIVDGRITNRNAESDLSEALSKSSGCLMIDGVGEDGYATGYAVTAGRTLYEAVIAALVLEKSAEVEILSDKIGGAKHLNPLEIFKMRRLYKKKYSKAETKAKLQEELSCDTLPSAPSDNSDSADFGEELSAESREEVLRRELVEYGKELVKTGLVQGTWGNLSARLDDKYMLVTPSGIDYMRLKPCDMVKVNIETAEFDKGLKPTSEKDLHAEIYKTRDDIDAVIHTHSEYSSVFAAAERDMPMLTVEAQDVFGPGVNTAKYAPPGTKKLASNTVKALSNNFACIMAHHGMVACAGSLKDAFEYCRLLEENGKRCLDK